MSPNKRIILNIAVTYGRSLYALVIGLFCGRWTLMTLGEVDYGLIGVVGGLAAFVSFLNGIMASGVGRFYAISVGAAQKDPEKGLEECHRWFTTAVVVHTILPAILIMIGYPIGEWAVRHFLTIPPERIQSSIWVWRFVCASTFIGMVGVPFSAWYTAKQEIAELTIYSFVTTTLNVGFMYYAVNHPGDWLAPLACWAMLLSIVPQLIICARAGILYPECKFKWKYVTAAGKRIREMMSYSGWLVIGALGDLLSGQGLNVLINKYFGLRVNAAQTVGSTFSAQCQTLSGSIIGAFWPAITNAYGAGDMETVRAYAYRVSRMATVLILVFAIPLSLEIDNVLRLWLKEPPHFAAGLCICSLAVAVVDKTSYGYAIAAHASGRIAKYIIIAGCAFLLVLPLAWFSLHMGGSVYWTGGALIVSRSLVAVLRVWYARPLVQTSARYWLLRILIPIVGAVSISLLFGMVPRLLLSESFGRIVVTTVVADSVLLYLTWIMIFDSVEKAFLLSKVEVVCNNFRRRSI